MSEYYPSLFVSVSEIDIAFRYKILIKKNRKAARIATAIILSMEKKYNEDNL